MFSIYFSLMLYLNCDCGSFTQTTGVMCFLSIFNSDKGCKLLHQSSLNNAIKRPLCIVNGSAFCIFLAIVYINHLNFKYVDFPQQQAYLL